MATNNFKAFALDPNANVLSQADWEALPALLAGFSSGKASSAQVNKAIRQATTIAALIGQFIANAGVDALDNGDVSGLVTKFTNAITTNLSLGTAATKNVGTSTGQIPDMSSFLSSLATNGYQRFPGGLIIQWGNGAPDSSGSVTINYPVAHTQKPFYIGFGYRQSNTPTAMQSIVLNDQIVNNIGFNAKCFQNDGSGMIPGQSAFFWFSVGK